MIPIIKWTIFQRRWSLFWWSVGISAFILLNMVFYPSFKDQAAELQKSFEGLPESAVQLFGGSTDFFSPVGFLNSQIYFIMLPLLLGILAIGLGSSLIAKEEQDKTIESLLARPISRTKLIFSKSLVGTLILILVSTLGTIATLISAALVNLEISSVRIIEASFVCFLLALSFGAVALLFTAIGRARGASLGIATTFAFGGYLISSLAGTVEWLKPPSKLFAFHYYQPEAILRNTYDWANIIFLILITIGCGLIAWLLFRRRDLA